MDSAHDLEQLPGLEPRQRLASSSGSVGGREAEQLLLPAVLVRRVQAHVDQLPGLGGGNLETEHGEVQVGRGVEVGAGLGGGVVVALGAGGVGSVGRGSGRADRSVVLRNRLEAEVLLVAGVGEREGGEVRALRGVDEAADVSCELLTESCIAGWHCDLLSGEDLKRLCRSGTVQREAEVGLESRDVQVRDGARETEGEAATSLSARLGGTGVRLEEGRGEEHAGEDGLKFVDDKGRGLESANHLIEAG